MTVWNCESNKISNIQISEEIMSNLQEFHLIIIPNSVLAAFYCIQIK